jgi:hypothetical protein
MKELDCTGGREALQEGLAGDGKTMLARENFGGPPVCVRTRTGRHVWHNSRTLTQDIQQGRLFARHS